MQTTEFETPIELECWMLKWGIMPVGHFRKKPDVVWPQEKPKKMQSVGWKPTEPGEQPPF